MHFDESSNHSLYRLQVVALYSKAFERRFANLVKGHLGIFEAPPHQKAYCFLALGRCGTVAFITAGCGILIILSAPHDFLDEAKATVA